MRSSPRRRAALVVALCAVAALLTASAASSAAPVTRVRVNGQPIRAVSITDVQRFSALSLLDLTRLKADGVNTVSLYVFRFMDTPQSNDLHAGPFTEPDASLAHTIDAAHAAGLAVELTPTAWVGPGTGAFYWRGAIHPTDHNAFFDSYRAMLTHYADLAQAHHVELFGIGGEMASLEGDADQWRHSISDVRAHYTGPLTYFTITGNVSRISWWRYVDVPGISPYVSLSTAADPSYEELVAAWRKVLLPQLRRIQQAVGRPLFIAETGYASSDHAAEHPENGAAGPANEGLQARLYRALLDTAVTDKAFDGLSLWRWAPTETGPTDRGFSPKGKAAECVLAGHWAAAGSASLRQCAALGRVSY